MSNDAEPRYERAYDPEQGSRLRVGARVRVVGGLYAGWVGVVVLIVTPRREPFVVAFADGNWTYAGAMELEPL